MCSCHSCLVLKKVRYNIYVHGKKSSGEYMDGYDSDRRRPPTSANERINMIHELVSDSGESSSSKKSGTGIKKQIDNNGYRSGELGKILQLL